MAKKIALGLEKAIDGQLDHTNFDGTFDVTAGDGDGASIAPDEDGMYRIDFDAFSREEADAPRTSA